MEIGEGAKISYFGLIHPYISICLNKISLVSDLRKAEKENVFLKSFLEKCLKKVRLNNLKVFTGQLLSSKIDFLTYLNGPPNSVIRSAKENLLNMGSVGSIIRLKKISVD